MPCEVHYSEKEVPELLELAVMVGLGFQFSQFLVDLRARAG